MSKRLTFRAAFIAALVATGAVLVQLATLFMVPSGVIVQPYAVAPEQFVAPLNTHTNTALLFFAADTLFPLSYLLIFVGLFAALEGRSRAFALVGLALGALTAFFDLTENAIFISYTLLAYNGSPVTTPDVVLVGVFTTLKWAFGFGTLYAFGVIFPTGSTFEKVLCALMLAFPLFGALSTALPELIVWRGVFFLVGMPLFAVYFRQQGANQPHEAA